MASLICNKISTQIDTETGTLTGRHGLFKAWQRAHIFELSLSKRVVLRGQLWELGVAEAESTTQKRWARGRGAGRSRHRLRARRASRSRPGLAARGGRRLFGPKGHDGSGGGVSGSSSHGANRTGNGPMGRSVLSSSPKTSHCERNFKRR